MTKKTVYAIKPVEGAEGDDRKTITIVVCLRHLFEMPEVDGDTVTSSPYDGDDPCEYCRFYSFLARIRARRLGRPRK